MKYGMILMREEEAVVAAAGVEVVEEHLHLGTMKK